MLFKFKSQAASDLIMLEADARSLLKIMLGDDPVKGIVQVQDLASAVAALTAAVLQDTLARQQQVDQAKNRVNDPDEDRLPLATVSLSQRAAPMLKMLQRCQAQGSDMVWGV
jgi:hypothetical protein